MSAAGLPAGVVADAGAAVRAYLRIGSAGEDALIAQLAASAVRIGEAFTGQALIARGHEDVLAPRGEWQALGGVPVSAVSGVVALPVTGAPSVLDVDAYAIDIDADARGWVRVARPLVETRIAVSYTAGLAAGWDDLPEAVAQGVVMLAAHLFNDRDAGRAPPVAVAALWRPFRTLRLGSEVHS